MSEFDPYHPCHHPFFTSDDVTLSFQLQLQVLSRRVNELERFRDSIPQLPPAYPPPSIPPHHYHHHHHLHHVHIHMLALRCSP
ncbi:hypothetical protein Hanom_Chr13g01212281 [Helianthus anomalus]